MLYTRRLASYVPKGKEKQAMKQQKAMLIALIVICLTVIVTALVTRKDLCEVRIRTFARQPEQLAPAAPAETTDGARYQITQF